VDAAGIASRIAFFAYDTDHGVELWASDGTEESAALLMDIRPGPVGAIDYPSVDFYASYRERKFGTLMNFAVFAANDGIHGSELWVTDATPLGTGLLRDIYPGDYPSTPHQFTRLGNSIVFSAEDEEHGLELWVTDGTYGGTKLVKDVAPGPASSVPDDLVVRDGVLYFSAWSPNYGREAWKSDWTSAGTVRISDIAPGPLSSSPQRFARSGNRLYFSATDQIHGYELWAISDDGTIPLFLDGFENESTSRWSAVQP
jgi:ELWxxDGT repeat protein